MELCFKKDDFKEKYFSQDNNNDSQSKETNKKNKIQRIDFLQSYQFFEYQIANGKYNRNSIGELLKDRPYSKRNDELSKCIMENEALVGSINKLRNFIIHQDADYEIKANDFENWSKFIERIKGIIK